MSHADTNNNNESVEELAKRLQKGSLGHCKWEDLSDVNVSFWMILAKAVKIIEIEARLEEVITATHQGKCEKCQWRINELTEQLKTLKGTQ
jgi:hypothetical protein